MNNFKKGGKIGFRKVHNRRREIQRIVDFNRENINEENLNDVFGEVQQNIPLQNMNINDLLLELEQPQDINEDDLLRWEQEGEGYKSYSDSDSDNDNDYNKYGEKIYNTFLKYLTGIVGNKETDSDQLTKIGKQLFGSKFSGVFPSDKIKLTSKSPYAIVNLDNSNQFGSHWTTVIKHGKEYLFYDSFGRKATKIIPSIFKLGGKIIETEDDVEQDIKQENCGQRSMSALFVYDQFGKDAFLQI